MNSPSKSIASPTDFYLQAHRQIFLSVLPSRLQPTVLATECFSTDGLVLIQALEAEAVHHPEKIHRYLNGPFERQLYRPTVSLPTYLLRSKHSKPKTLPTVLPTDCLATDGPVAVEARETKNPTDSFIDRLSRYRRTCCGRSTRNRRCPALPRRPSPPSCRT